MHIGIELDGLRYLNKHGGGSKKKNEELEILSLIQLSIKLGGKLLQDRWEHEQKSAIQQKQIYLYFTTLSETIITSKLLLHLR